MSRTIRTMLALLGVAACGEPKRAATESAPAPPTPTSVAPGAASATSVPGEGMSIEARVAGFQRALESGDLDTATTHFHAVAEADPALAVRLGLRRRLTEVIARSGGPRPVADVHWQSLFVSGDPRVDGDGAAGSAKGSMSARDGGVNHD